MVFVIAVPLGVFGNRYVSEMPMLFLYLSVFIAGVMLHVVWHIWEEVKNKNTLSYVLLVVGLGLGYLITWAHEG
jgi:hypothetical protein